MKRPRLTEEPRADLDLTNLIDIIFAILIVFMVTAPQLVRNVDVDLAKVDQAIEIPDSENFLQVTLSPKLPGLAVLSDSKGSLKDTSSLKQLSQRINYHLQSGKIGQKSVVQLISDKNAPSSETIESIQQIRASQANKLSIQVLD